MPQYLSDDNSKGLGNGLVPSCNNVQGITWANVEINIVDELVLHLSLVVEWSFTKPQMSCYL